MGSLQFISNLFDLIMSPFQSISPLWALSLFSLLAGLLMLLIFRYTSDQKRIKETKNGIKAHLLELWLFRDDPWIMISAQWQLLRLNGRYMRLALKPMLVMIVPMALILISLEGWFGYRPLQPGEAVIISVQVGDEELGLLEKASLKANGAITVETPPLRIQSAHEVDWRVRASRVGVHKVSLDLTESILEKQVVVTQGLARVSSSRLSSELWQVLLYPGEPHIPQQFGIQRIDVHYPARSINIFHWSLHWLVVFFVLSIVFALVFKRIFKVEL
ncbi:MAG: hypothetical protein HY694_05880 [Deltaproteobacteria bacterium]|nr:hypothetical protein [Deltaproteobacteria bacterium]